MSLKLEMSIKPIRASALFLHSNSDISFCSWLLRCFVPLSLVPFLSAFRRYCIIVIIETICNIKAMPFPWKNRDKFHPHSQATMLPKTKKERKGGVGKTEERKEHNANNNIERHEFCFGFRKCIRNTKNKQSKRTNERNKNNLVKLNLWHI